jgi:hypothetical protein
MEAVRSSETLVSTYKSIRHYNTEDIFSTSAVKMEAVRSSETLVSTYKSIRHYNTEDQHDCTCQLQHARIQCEIMFQQQLEE